jgi:hypothetical protein
MIAMLLASWICVAATTFEAAPTLGASTVIVVSDGDGLPSPGETVRVVYRPGLAGAVEQAVGITDRRGRVRWEPAQAGLVAVRAGRDEQITRVAWPSPPAATLVLLVALLLASLGSVAVGLGGRWGWRPASRPGKG